MTLAVVVPTYNPDQFKIFIDAWQEQFERHNVELVVVEDKPETWEKLPDFIPYRTGSIRSWGFLKAWHEGWDVITLDDDCAPAEDVDLIEEYRIAFTQSLPVSEYYDIGHTFGLDQFMRGFPFKDRHVNHPILQYGGWDNVPDLDAITQDDYERSGRAITGHHFDRRYMTVPKGCALTGCIMNVAILHEAIPLMYQLIMGVDQVGYDRYDDIFSGLFAKKICDHLNLPVLINGKASIIHTRQSDTATNLAKEAAGHEFNEVLWERLSGIELTGDSVIRCYEQLMDQVQTAWFGAYGYRIIKGMYGWLHALEP